MKIHPQLRTSLFAAILIVASVVFVETATAQLPNTVYESNFYDGTVRAYNATTGLLIPTFNCTATGAGATPDGVAIYGNTLYVADQTNGTITTYNAITGAATGTLATGLIAPTGLAVSGSTLYVAAQSSNTIAAYNLTTGLPLAGFSSAASVNSPYALTLSGTSLYASSVGGGFVGVYNGTTGAVINASLVGSVTGPRGVAISGNTLYLALGNSIYEYDATTGALLNGGAFISGLNAPHGISVLGNTLYTANFGDGTIREFNATTGAAVGTFVVPTGLNGASFVYVTGVPEPGVWALLLVAGGCAAVARRHGFRRVSPR